ncbi:RNA-directed RNA polymerase [ssRNA phage SRR7976356_4]|uniref:RNA-directed RNA polymerase n=1 Tax=ssRNA phage SRR7976356_4 TaxID=2786735 RepID=A0A8S5KZU5_9VIRU|nr:RNA-directed RNA polymerase [ssRNA phage SRR7976356_4]DAD51230.1 TPA_asm: RNA-directed RNA polymerase [ssRNA phage SRR7976356_4]
MSSDKAFVLYNLLCEDLAVADRLAVSSLPLNSNCETQIVAINQLRTSFLKKYVANENDDAETRAIEAFLASNELCSQWVDPAKRADVDELDATLWGEFLNVTHSFFKPNGDDLLSLTEIVDGLKPGPGASVGARGDSMYQKLFSSPLTTQDPALYSWYRAMCKRSPIHYAAELCRVAKYGAYTLTEGNALQTVDKNTEIRRVICTEPSLEMLFQQAIGGLFAKRLESYFGLSLSEQPDNNRELARRGSITHELCTLDLKEASNSVSLGLCSATIPKYTLGWMLQTRSRITKLPDGSHVDLQMMSSMGNAFTFPLQTALFASMIKACFKVAGMRFRRSEAAVFRSIKATTSGLCDTRRMRRVDWAVFGDDLIVPKSIVGLLTRLLRLAGFRLNLDKSFVDGDFRESCGHDYYRGVNVRGVYLKSLRTRQDYVSIYNRLIAWGCNHGVDLPSVEAFFASLDWWKSAPRVPPYEAVDAGIFVAAPPILSRRSNRLQAVVYDRWAPVIPALDLQALVDDYANGTAVKRPEGVMVNAELYGGLKIKSFISNHAGAAMTVIAGHAVDGRIPLRLPRGVRTQYRKVRAASSGWNRQPEASLFTYAGFLAFLNR